MKNAIVFVGAGIAAYLLYKHFANKPEEVVIAPKPLPQNTIEGAEELELSASGAQNANDVLAPMFGAGN